MPNFTIRRTPSGRAYLNAGCGGTFSPEWTNLDIGGRPPDVLRHDLRHPLPFPAGAFDAVYTSHALEHLGPEAAERFLAELRRCLAPGGICRVVVPDFEQVCREYLARLEEAARPGADAGADRRYRWALVEVIDQFVREEPGGRMLRLLRQGDVDQAYVLARGGEEFRPHLGEAARLKPRREPGAWTRARRRIQARLGLGRRKGPRETGELHRWAYDRYSLGRLLEQVGLGGVEQQPFDRSAIPEWERWRLDAAPDGRGPRKPDSLYLEARRTA